MTDEKKQPVPQPVVARMLKRITPAELTPGRTIYEEGEDYYVDEVRLLADRVAVALVSAGQHRRRWMEFRNKPERVVSVYPDWLEMADAKQHVDDVQASVVADEVNGERYLAVWFDEDGDDYGHGFVVRFDSLRPDDDHHIGNPHNIDPAGDDGLVWEAREPKEPE